MPDSASIRKLLGELGAAPRKRLGQNFMMSDAHLEAIAGALGVTTDVPIVEIGPGLGFLTVFLLRRGFQVTAVEKDRAFARSLERRLADPRLCVVETDFLKADPAGLGLGGSFAVAGNIPYSITAPIVEWLIEHRAGGQACPGVCEAVLTVQKEVAERLAAKLGTKAWGSLTIFVRTFADVAVVRSIGRSAFFPPPKVDSAVVRIVFLQSPREDLGDPNLYFSLVRRAFQKRRKTILNALDGIVVGAHSRAPLQKSDLSKIFETCNIDPRRRPETLTLAEWASLSRCYS